MSSNKTKCIIIGIMTLFLLSGTSPIFTVSADDLLTTLNNGELDIGISSGKLYEVEDDLHVTVTADGGSTIVVGAEVTFSGATLSRTTGEDGSVRFPIGEIVDGDKEYEDHTITASHPEYNTATRGVQIWNRCIKIALIPSTVVDGDTFDVRFKDHHDDWIGGTFHFNSQSYTVLPTGTKIQAPYLPEAPDGTAGNDESFSVYSKKIGYKTSEIHTITVINKNHAVFDFNPGQPSGPLSVDVGDENENGNKYSTSAKDPDGGDVKIRFKWGDGQETDWIQASSGQKVERPHYWYDTGMYAITVEAKDLHEPAEVKTSACMVFVGNKQPSKASTPTGENEVSVGSQATFSSSASDPEGHSLKFCFDWGDEDKSWTDLDCCSCSHSWSQPGTYPIKAKAMDEYGLESARWSNVKYVVVGNLDPIITSFQVKFVRTGVRKIIVTAEDPNEADNVQFYVNWDDGYSSGWSGGTKRVREKGGYYHTYEETHEFKEKGQYTILVKIRDDAGDSDDSATKTVTINIGADAGISMEIAKAEAAVVYQMIPKTIIDENGQPLVVDDSYSVIANPDGTYDVQQNDVTVQEGVESVQNYFTNNDAQTGTTDIPEDDNNNEDNNDVNQVPHASISGPSSGDTGQSLSFSASDSSDPEGKSLSYRWKWTGHEWWTPPSSNPTKSISFNNPGSKTVQVKAIDNDGATDTASKSVTISDDDNNCCFPAGTLISMADGSTKAIEDVQIGEYVLSYNTKDHELTTCKVLETVSPIRKGVYSINQGLVRPTDDHPLYVMKSDGVTGWAAIDPVHAESGYAMNAMMLEVGDKIFNSDGQWIKIESIEYQPGVIQTYNLEDVSGKSNFFANGILVHNAADCDDSSDDDSSSSGGVTLSSSFYTEEKSDEDVTVNIQFDGSGTFLNDFYQESEGTLQVSSSTYQTSGEVQQKSFLFAESSIIMSLLETFAEKFPALRNFLLNKGIINIDLPTDESAQENSDITSEDNTPIEEPEPVEEDTSDETQTDPEVLTEEDLVLVWDFGDGNFVAGVKPVHTYEVKKDSEYERYIDSEENPNIYTSYINPSDIPLEDPLPTINEYILAEYYVTLYVVIDKEHILESLEKINEEDLSGFEIADTDTTTITIKSSEHTMKIEKPEQNYDLFLYSF